MDANGYEVITSALSDAEVPGFSVNPQPEGEQNAIFLTVEARDMPPATILNALGSAGLLQMPGSQDLLRRKTPNLKIIGVETGSVTFEDVNRPIRRQM